MKIVEFEMDKKLVTKKHSVITTATATQELPTQIVMEFFENNIPITQAPKDVVLKKSNSAIQIISTLGLLERKIIDACLFVASHRLNENILHSADLDYFKWLLSFNSQNRDHLKKSIANIQQTLIQFNVVDATNPTKDFWHSTPFLYDVSLSSGRIYFRIPESLQQSLMNPRSWTYLSFRIKNRFTSEYAYILYDRCRADQFRGATDFWSITEFRTIMNTVDIYSQFQDLQKRVIKPAIEQINEHSDIYITADYKTRGRTKTHIRFIIEENPNVVKFEHDKEKFPMEIFNTLKDDFGFSNAQIDEVAERPMEYLVEKIEFTKHRINTSKNPIARPDLYLLKALKEDLRFNTTEISVFESEKKAQLQLTSKEEKKQEAKVKTKKGNDVLDAFNALGEVEQQSLIGAYQLTTDYLKVVKPMMIGKQFTLESSLVSKTFSKYLQETTELGQA